ncbi:hypothetical protein ACFUPZ_07500 [Microbacterium oxydans]|jgi:hypothetical protein|uniref:hypothetical protein n=1 Tax=Microbacterium TaxID=33882 RepID=UPI0032ECCA83
MTNNIDKTARVAELTDELDGAAAPEPVGVRRLREAREAAAAREVSQIPEVEGVPLVEAGDVVHATATGMHLPRTTSLWGGLPALPLTRGDRVVVTEEMIAADVDRNGNPGWTALVHDPDRQIARWGRVHLAPGEPPAGMQPWEHGDAEWSEQREIARKAAWSETDPKRRAEALQRVTEVYGAPPTTSTVHAVYKGDVAYEAQQAAIAASAAAGTPNLRGGVS